MKKLALIFLMLLPFTALGAQRQAEGLDVTEMIFEHIGDSYEWHITKLNDRDVTIHLPIIVCGKNCGWQCFSSARLADGAEYRGLRIARKGEDFEGKVVERDGACWRRPFDISITKTVLALMMDSLLLVLLILLCARWYRTHDVMKEAPRGLAGLMEPLIMMVNDDIIKSAIGPDYRKYSPYLLTAFFFILINNLMGIIPFFPGGANVTGNIAITFILALCTFLAVNLFGNKHYWKDILWPDVPVFLKAPLPLMPLIEIVGLFTKPFSLMIRLFANILAGHAMILGVVSVIFVTASMAPAISSSMSVIAVIFGVFMNCLELLVAFIQAYVFTMLSSVFIGMSRQNE